MGFQENKARQIFPKNKQFLPSDTHTYVCLSGGKKCWFFGKSDVLCFLETPVLRFALSPYYRQYQVFELQVGFCIELIEEKQGYKNYGL